MKEISVRNEYFLGILTTYSDYIMNNAELLEELHDVNNIMEYDQAKEREFTDEFLEELLDDPKSHNGFPGLLKGFELDAYFGKYRFNQHEKDMIDDILFKMTRELGAHRNALCAYYPPDGGITWHNNFNAPGYNILFTYSRTGEGCFKYYDTETEEVVVMPDVGGVWTAKAGYYGGFEEDPKTWVWHMAETQCDRLTFAYVIPDKTLWEMMIEEIETP